MGDGRPVPAEGAQLTAVASVGTPPRDPSSDPAIDRRALERLESTLGTKAGTLLPTLLDGFLRDAVKLQLTARRGLQDNKPEDLRRAAHTLKSNAANFGATLLASKCQELENAAKNATLEGAGAMLDEIGAAYERARAELEQMRETWIHG
jgi:HPt (histidine-containing phosphotransfer) domain-containing protein